MADETHSSEVVLSSQSTTSTPGGTTQEAVPAPVVPSGEQPAKIPETITEERDPQSSPVLDLNASSSNPTEQPAKSSSEPPTSIPETTPEIHVLVSAPALESGDKPSPSVENAAKILEDQNQLNEEFLDAAAAGEKDEFCRLIAKGAEVTAKKRNKETALHLASRNGYLEIVKEILQYHKEIGINEVDSDGWTALIGAARNDELGIVQELLKETNPSPILSIKDEDEMTALFVAALYGHEAVVGTLLDYLKDKPYLDGEKDHAYTALHKAARDGQTNAVDLLSNGMTPVQINAVDSEGFTALFRGAEKDSEGREEIVNLLLSRGAEIIPPDNHGWTPLRNISYAKDGPFMRQMFEYYLDGDASDGNSDDDSDDGGQDMIGNDDESHETPLYRAARKGLDLVVRRMLDDDAIPKRSKTGQTPLQFATSKGRSKVVKVFLEKRTREERGKRDPEIQKAFLIAVRKMDVVTVQPFLKFLGDGELQDIEDDDVIEDWAEEREKTYLTHEVVKLLLKLKKFKQKKRVENKLDEVLEHRSWRALHWAVYHGQPVVVLSLLKSGRIKEKETKEAEKMASIIVGDLKRNLNTGRGTTERNQNTTRKESVAGVSNPENQQEGPRGTEPTPEERQMEQLADKDEEKRYSATLEMLRFSGMLLDAAEVKTSESEKQYEKPKSDFDDLTPFKASIVDFYEKSAERASYLRQSHDVHAVIYGEGPNSLMEKALKTLEQGELRVEPYRVEDRKLRWIHLSANNMEWMNDLAMRLCYDNDTKHTNESEFFSLDHFLQRSFHQLPSGVDGGHFMRPGCVKDAQPPQKREERAPSRARSVDDYFPRHRSRSRDSSESQRGKSKERTPDGLIHRLALYMPYLSFATLTRSPPPRHPIKRQKTTEYERSEEIPMKEKRDDEQTLNTDREETHPQTQDKERAAKWKPRLGKDTHLQSLEHNNQSQNTGQSPDGELPAAIMQEDQTTGRNVGQQQNSEHKKEVVDQQESASYQPEPEFRHDYFEENGPKIMENEAYRRLFDLYKGKVVHGTRTLDEAYYHSLSYDDVNHRNIDQVVTKRVHSLDPNHKQTWTILRVDQLWLWVIDNDTIISSSTHRKDYEEDPVIESIWRHLRDGRGDGKGSLAPSSAAELSEFIMEFCVGFFDTATCNVGRTTESIHQIFENSINEMAIREAALFSEFTTKVRSTIDDLKYERDEKYGQKEVERLLGETQPKARNNTGKSDTSEETAVVSHGEAQGGKLYAKEDRNEGKDISRKPKKRLAKGKADEDLQTRNQIIANLQSISDAADLLMEIKDIRDELKILKSILVHQRKAWNDFKDEVHVENQLKGPASYMINEIKEMDDTAERIQTAINSILDLEQNEASISEAMSSRKQAEESIQQGRTLMVFTVVTIIFLPMSFLVSFFALNITSFPHSEGDLQFAPGWIYPRIFGITTAISILLIVAAFYIDNLSRIIRGARIPADESYSKRSLWKFRSMVKRYSKKNASKGPKATGGSVTPDKSRPSQIEENDEKGDVSTTTAKEINARYRSIREKFNMRWPPRMLSTGDRHEGVTSVVSSNDVWAQNGVLEKGSR